MKILALIIFTSAVFSASAFGKTTLFYSKNGHFIDGYDPVSYTQKTGPKKGKKIFQSELGDTNVLFANMDNKVLFDQNPGKYTPAYNGYCAYAMAKDQLYKVNPKNFKLIDGKVHLFYESLWIDTKKKWNKSEADFKSKADRFWTAREKK